MRFVCDPEFATRYDISVCAGGRGISATHVNPLKEGGGERGWSWSVGSFCLKWIWWECAFDLNVNEWATESDWPRILFHNYFFGSVPFLSSKGAFDGFIFAAFFLREVYVMWTRFGAAIDPRTMCHWDDSRMGMIEYSGVHMIRSRIRHHHTRLICGIAISKSQPPNAMKHKTDFRIGRHNRRFGIFWAVMFIVCWRQCAIKRGR